MANTAFSNYTEANVSNHLFRTGTWAKTGTLYFALFTSAPDDTGGGTEVSGGSYARVAVTPSDSNFSVTGNAATNITAITFPTPSAAWGTITHAVIYDAATSGNQLLWSELAAAKTVGATDPAPYFAPGTYVCTYNSTSIALATQVLSFIFKTLTTWTKPSTLYFDFYTTAPTSSGGGVKATGGSYAAVAVTPLDANFTQTVIGSDGATSVANAGALTFPAPTANWGAIEAIGVSTSAGLFVGHTSFATRNINSGDSAPVIAAGGVTWAIS
jgi:hypothetical protein